MKKIDIITEPQAFAALRTGESILKYPLALFSFKSKNAVKSQGTALVSRGVAENPVGKFHLQFREILQIYKEKKIVLCQERPHGSAIVI